MRPRSNWRSAVLARIATITAPSCLSASRGNIDAATSFEPKPLLERGMTAVTMIREGTSRSHSPNQKVIHAHALPTQSTVIILLELHVKTENGSNTERAIFQYRDLRDPQNPPCSIHTSLSAKKKETHAKTKNWSKPKGCHFILRTFRGPQHPWLYDEDKKRKRCLKKHGTRTERVTFHLQN